MFPPENPHTPINHCVRSHWCHSFRNCPQRARVLIIKIDRRDGMQLQCRNVDNVEEEGNRNFGDAREGKAFKGG